MFSELSLAPRYRLDDLSPWLKGIDPLRRYWIQVNGEQDLVRQLPGLRSDDFEVFRQSIRSFRQMTAGEILSLSAELGQELTIHCVGENCYAISDTTTPHPVWHLFDYESLESLLMTAHPDWRCAPQHLTLGRSLLSLAFEHPASVQAA
jgi:hypothetical protein